MRRLAPLLLAALGLFLTGCCALSQRLSIARSEWAARVTPAHAPTQADPDSDGQP